VLNQCHPEFPANLDSTTTGVYAGVAVVKAVGVVTPHQAAAWLHAISQDKEIVVDMRLGESYVEQTKNDESPGVSLRSPLVRAASLS